MSVEIKYTEIDLSENSKAIRYDKIAGKQGESYVRGIKFILSPEYSDWLVFVETKNADGKPDRKLIADFKDNIAIYKFSKQDLSAKGNLLLDLVLENGDMVYKPFSGEFAVKYAICAESEFVDINPDDSEDNTSVIGKEYIQVIKDNAKLRHDHNNKDLVLDHLGLNQSGDRPTFKENNELAFKKDIEDKLRDFDFTEIKKSILKDVPVPDWSQNNDKENGFIKNRTHYIKKEPAKIWDNNNISLSPYRTLESIMADEQINTQNIIVRILDQHRIEILYETTLTLVASEPDVGESYFYGNRYLESVAGAFIYGSEYGDNSCPILLYKGEFNPDGWSFYMDESYLENADDQSLYYVELSDADNIETQYITLDEGFIPNTIARKEDVKSEVEHALVKAKESGEFDGDPYELTDIDKNIIKEAVLAEIPETDLTNYAKKDDVYTKREIDSKGFITKEDLPENDVIEESDPTVPDWAKQPDKPEYEASEIKYVNDKIWDKTGTIKAALDEAIDYVTTAIPEISEKIDDINDKNYIEESDLQDKIDSALESAKASGEFDGENGQDGDDGLSAYQIWLNAGNTGTESDFLKSLKGEDGEGGASVTHEWNGTVLTITSANGTSSADLKGETGNSGVYVGSGEMPEGYNVQIDPTGDIIHIPSIDEIVTAVLAQLPKAEEDEF